MSRFTEHNQKETVVQREGENVPWFNICVTFQGELAEIEKSNLHNKWKQLQLFGFRAELKLPLTAVTNPLARLPEVCLYTHSDLSEAFVEHCHQQLGQHDNHHDVVGAYDHGAHERTQLLRVADAGDEECDVRQGEYVPE